MFQQKVGFFKNSRFVISRSEVRLLSSAPLSIQPPYLGRQPSVVIGKSHPCESGLEVATIGVNSAILGMPIHLPASNQTFGENTPVDCEGHIALSEIKA